MHDPLLPEVLPLRHASRNIVRELGFLQSCFGEAGVAHADAHALMEIDAAGRIAQRALARALGLDAAATSRIVARLVARRWIRATKDCGDARRPALSLTAAGRKRLGIIHGPANARVHGALATLSEAERYRVLSGMRLYARALRATRLEDEFQIRPIARRDSAALAADYREPRSAYFVAVRDGRLVGGAGLAPLQGGDAKTCELQKVYLAPEARGHGLGRHMLELCLRTARALGYRRAYVETLSRLTDARALYEKSGFTALPGPLGATGHAAEVWYGRPL